MNSQTPHPNALSPQEILLKRRQFLRRMASGLMVVYGGAALSGAAFAEELLRTPAQTEGPFYPDHLPLDTDNDLIIVNKSLTRAVGEITHFSGRILDARGNPVKGAVIEIWQVDNKGAYIHSQDPQNQNRDKNFQGYGRFETGKSGEYRFRTVKPVAYPGRTPHIHVKVQKANKELLTTQCYIKDDPRNLRDGIFMSVSDAKLRASLCAPFVPLKKSRIGELTARFDIVLGYTPVA